MLGKFCSKIRMLKGSPKIDTGIRYCFGAPYVTDALAADLCEVGAFAHPAFLKEHHFENIKSKCFMTFDTRECY